MYWKGCTGKLVRRSSTPGIPWTPDTHEDRGDGILIVLPPEVHKSLLVELIPSALVAALTAHNRAHPDEEGIRLRMSLHAGEVRYDQHGVTGQAVNWAFRLVDAKLLKAALASSSWVLAIIASSWFFDQVIRHAAVGIPPTYRRVLVRAKDDTQPGWICLPDDTRAARIRERRRVPVLRTGERRAAAHGRGCRIRARTGGRKVGGRLSRLGHDETPPGIQSHHGRGGRHSHRRRCQDTPATAAASPTAGPAAPPRPSHP